MKKIFATCTLVLIIASAQSQTTFGIKGGISMTTLVGEGYKSKPGFHAGGFVNIAVKNGFSLQPEVYFATQGAKWEGSGKTELGYINIPLLARYSSAAGFYGETGPQVGFMVSAYDTYDGEKEDVKEYLNTTDFAWSFGAGYQLNQKLGVNLRYNLGLNKFWKDEKNSALQIGIQLTLGSKGK